MALSQDGSETLTISLRGIDLFCELRGQGEPLLLLHGFTGSAADFAYAGREQFARHHRLIVPDARGHGSTTNDQAVIRHDECARDMLHLLDKLSLKRVKALGISMGGNILLHMATLDPARIEAMVLVSATPRFPEQARALMRSLPTEPSPEDWTRLRTQHHLGDAQIAALWQAQRAFADSHDDLCFTPQALAQIKARTLVYAGRSDPLYPVSLAEELAQNIPGAQLELTEGGHSPVFLDESVPFVARALRFLAD